MLLNDYDELLKDPRWHAKRRKILRRDNFTCQHCWAKDCTLQVHHITRGPMGRNAAPWECTNDCLVTLCVPCHKAETFYGNDAQRYLIQVMMQKRVNPETIRNLTKAVEEMYNVKVGAKLNLDWLLKDCPKEEANAHDIIRALSDLINTIGRRFCADPFMNSLTRVLEKMPDVKPGTSLEFWFEAE